MSWPKQETDTTDVKNSSHFMKAAKSGLPVVRAIMKRSGGWHPEMNCEKQTINNIDKKRKEMLNICVSHS